MGKPKMACPYATHPSLRILLLELRPPGMLCIGNPLSCRCRQLSFAPSPVLRPASPLKALIALSTQWEWGFSPY